MNEEGIIFLMLSMLIPLIIISSLSAFGKGIASIIVIIFVLLTIGILLAINWLDYIVIPMFTQILNISFQPAQGFNIPPRQDCIIKEANGLFYAYAYVTANLYAYEFKQETPPEEVNLKVMTAPENWERIISGLEFPVRFSIIAAGLDAQNVRDELEGKRSYQQFQMSQALQSNSANSAVTIGEIQRKINIIQAKIDRISHGEKPIASLMYITTFAVGVSAKDAEDKVSSQVESIRIAFSSMNLETSRLQGRELYILFQFEYGLPTTYQEFTSYFEQQT
ncbi:MAG: hypothetical protein ACP5RP_00970 [Candidatus Micrarchaeia archaeon]